VAGGGGCWQGMGTSAWLTALADLSACMDHGALLLLWMGGGRRNKSLSVESKNAHSTSFPPALPTRLVPTTNHRAMMTRRTGTTPSPPPCRPRCGARASCCCGCWMRWRWVGEGAGGVGCEGNPRPCKGGLHACSS